MIRKDKNIMKRSRPISQGERGSGAVVYWMERDHRIGDNWALLYAQQEALDREKPLTILTVISPESLSSPSIKTRFKLRGLAELCRQSSKLNIQFSIIAGRYSDVVPAFTTAVDCHLLVTDFSPLRHKKQSLVEIAHQVKCPFTEVDAHNIVPAWVASSKKEYGAYTLRPKIQRLLPEYLSDFPKILKHSPQQPYVPLADHQDLNEAVARYAQADCGEFAPGPKAAEKYMMEFVGNKLTAYDKDRNNPNVDGQSGLSPYLHSGQLSAQRLAYLTRNAKADQAAKESFLEELIIRRELADNFCLFEEHYDGFAGFHPWAQKTLNEHRGDRRQYCYSQEQLENAETHESLWNSCQRNLVRSSKLHGFLRMYWAKKILEWTSSPEEALHIANYLNDKYSIDGCDPNGYTGTAWSIGGIHDRAWQEREIFGKIRYMNERGCRRKFKVDEYISAN